MHESDTGLVEGIKKNSDSPIITGQPKFFKQAKDLNGYFSKDDPHMASKHMKRCSTSPVVRDASHLQPVRMAIIGTLQGLLSWSNSEDRVPNAGDKGSITGQ